ncbi:hypothetical protein CJ203_08065 [Corynebacterium tuscaniense]|uniref:Uncharacterized protein n=1 Tax=Corynebacterium tuscaniense TaxID=302449 RepID=A0A2N6T3Z6_9CORY|nr:hypothetical protein CJ203_08065 [Corynebacterium tuscaniense]
MNYFEREFKEMAERFQRTTIKWWRPDMTLEEAYEAIRALPIDPEHAIENPTQPVNCSPLVGLRSQLSTSGE